MAYAIIAGVTVPMTPEAPLRKEQPVGALRRAFDRSVHSSVRGYKLEWLGCKTAWIDRTTADTLRAALKGTPPLTVSGTMFGSVTSVYIENIEEVEKARLAVAGVSTEHVKLQFDVLEA